MKKVDRGLKRGFTLIEMLVVIVIIAILMGLVFRLSRGVLSRNESAREVARLSILKALLEEFHAEYGIYPPVPEYNGVQPVEFTGPFPDPEVANDLGHYISNNEYPFKFGLLSFFLNREEFGERTFIYANGRAGSPEATGAWEKYNRKLNDSAPFVKISTKDEAFVKRVKPILDKLKNEHSILSPWTEYDKSGHTVGFKARLCDSWGHSYVYVSEPPYTSFIVFSKGPDNAYCDRHPADRTGDCCKNGKYNKDNIYGDLGDK